MFCEKCGKKLNDGAKYCSECGAKVEPINKSAYNHKVIPRIKHENSNIKCKNHEKNLDNKDNRNKKTTDYKDDTVEVNYYKDKFEPQYRSNKHSENSRSSRNNKHKNNSGLVVVIAILALSIIAIIALGGFLGYKILFINNSKEVAKNEPKSSVVEVVSDKEIEKVEKNKKAEVKSLNKENDKKVKQPKKRKIKKVIKSTPAPAAPTPDPVANNNEFIFPDSQTVLIKKEQLEPMSKDQLLYARNEIFARHGRKFTDPNIAAYFSSKSWYKPTVEAADFDRRRDKIFNDIEKQNIQLIVDVEHSKGYFY